jgi:glycosyltransferase involved in cell wall biosynthesis
VFFADIPTPYILPVLGELSKLVDLTVLFGAAHGSRGMDWQLEPSAFRHAFVGGLVLRRASTSGPDLYVDPRVMVAITRAHPDVVISPAFSLPTVYAALHGALIGSRLLIYSDGTRLTESTLGRGQRLARHLLIGRAAGCVGLSTDAGRRFQELGCPQSRIFRAPHSTALGRLRAAGAARAPAPAGILRVLAVSRLIPRKGIDSVIEAVGLAHASEPGISLDIVGTGSEERHLRALAARCAPEAVRFHGFVDQPRLPDIYRDADVFAFPSRRDQFGVVALEAAAAGLPLLASVHAGATTDLVADGHSGFVIDPDDVCTVADRLLRLARDPDLRLTMGAAARERTSAHEPEVAARGYATAIDHALATGPRGPRFLKPLRRAA